MLLVGPVPPPEFGVARATELMLESSTLAKHLDIYHLDTSDRRSVANIGRLDFRNLYLGIKHVCQLAGLALRKRPDVTLLTASQGTLGLLRDGLLVLTSRMFRSKVVCYLRGGGYADLRATRGRLAAWTLRRICRSSARVLVLSHNLVDMAHAVHPKAKVAVVPNGCPPAVRPDQAGGRDESHPVLLYMGKLSHKKGLSDVLRAAGKMARSVPGLEFVIAGGWDPPEYQQHTRRLIQDLDLSDTVRFVGPVAGDEKTDLLARAWVVVVPSHSEGQPWVILEAMSAGIPVVATDTGAIAETVADGVSGFVVPIGDTAALAERMRALLTDDELWLRMKKASLEEHRARFAVERSHTLLAEELRLVVFDRG